MHNEEMIFIFIYFSSLKIGQSGKSAKELEKVIALMKKIIVKLQDENNALKRSAGAVANVK